MKILIDAMGGDNAPLSVLEGCLLAETELGVRPTLVGNRELLTDTARQNGLDISRFEILHAQNMIAMDAMPLSVRSAPDTSMRVGLTALAAGKADAFVSAGNTGALQVGANLFVGRIPGVSRSAIATVLPCETPVLMLDCGANSTFTPELLCEYALMGSIYMRKVHGTDAPRVGLLNIGEEPAKGTPAHAQAYRTLCDFPQILFIGNVEPDAVFRGKCDVVVADGFSGNILLKTFESVGRLIFSRVEEAVGFDRENAERTHGSQYARYIAAQKRFDPAEYGGAPLIGIRAPVVKAHGNSGAEAIKNAIRQAMRYAAGGVIFEIARGLDGACAP